MSIRLRSTAGTQDLMTSIRTAAEAHRNMTESA